jgi:hypothetical protein
LAAAAAGAHPDFLMTLGGADDDLAARVVAMVSGD